MDNLIPNLNIKENIEVGAYLSDNPLDVDEILNSNLTPMQKLIIEFLYSNNVFLKRSYSSRTGKIRIERQLKKGNYTFRTEPNETMIHTENADGIHPAEGGIVVARFPETNVAAAIGHDASAEGGSKTLSWSIMLESAYDFDTLYQQSINWLMK